MGISILNLEKSYGRQALFSDVSFQINTGERVGLVGRNGHGKTTLFKIITGEELPDRGEVIISKNYTFGYLQQTIAFTASSALEEILSVIPSEEKVNRKWEGEKMLMGFGFSKADFDRAPGSFSGGYQMRLQLIKVLLQKPNILLLDEPTNFLDIGSVRWFIQFLKKWSGEIFFVSHDRNFMDSIATHIVGIHRQKVRKITGKVNDYFRLIEQEETTYEKDRVNALRRQKQMEAFIDGFRAKARQAGMVQSRIKTLEKKEKMEVLALVEKLAFTFNEIEAPHKYAVKISNIAFRYSETEPWLFSKFSFELAHNARVGIIGLNGKGKSTFLRVIHKDLPPSEGSVVWHPKVVSAFFAQAHTVSLNLENTIEDEILDVLERPVVTQARNICGQMMFGGDSALKKIKVLSGGEKCRVLLGKLLARPTNFLMLDEPDHHLDVESCEALSRALLKYSGALLLVTHNEFLLKEVCQELLVFTDTDIIYFRGTYNEFLNQEGSKKFDNPQSFDFENMAHSGSNHKKNDRKQRAEYVQLKSKLLRPLVLHIEAIERDITSCEEKILTLDSALIEASESGDFVKIRDCSAERAKLMETIDLKFDELEKKSLELDKLKQQYGNQTHDA